MKLRVLPSYDLPTLQAACQTDIPLWVRGGTAALQHSAIARANPDITFGIAKSVAWYVDWCAGQVLMYQRCVDSHPELLRTSLRCEYFTDDPWDPAIEYAHFVGMYPGFSIAIRRSFYEALALEDDRMIAVQGGMGRKVLIVRLHTVMAAISECRMPGYVPVHEDPENRLIDAHRYWRE